MQQFKHYKLCLYFVRDRPFFLTKLLAPLVHFCLQGSVTMLGMLTALLTQLVGTIPEELGSLKNLTAFKLENNIFEGTLPVSLR